MQDNALIYIHIRIHTAKV